MPDHSLTLWLDCLHNLLPPTHAALIGAGNGSSPWVQWLLQCSQLPNVTLLEADSDQYHLLEQRLAVLPQSNQIQALHGLAGLQNGEQSFYVANLVAESGLLTPSSLTSVWPNLQTVHERTMHATTLQELLSKQLVGEKDDKLHLWLMVDCLPAAPLLHSADAMLRQVDVVLARVLLRQDDSQSGKIDGASLDDVSQILCGMQQVALQPTRHPAIAYALFVRDYRMALQQQTRITDEIQVKCLAEIQVKTGLQQKLEQVAKAQQDLEAKLTQQSQVAQDVQAKLEAETRAKAGLQQKLEQAAKAQQDLEAKLTQQSQVAQDVQAKLEAEARAKAGLQQKLEQAAKEQQGREAELSREANVVKKLQATLEAETQSRTDLLQELKRSNEANQVLTADLAQKNELITLLKKQTDELISTRKFLDASLKKEIANSTKQIEASMGLQSYFATGVVPSINIERQPWPISSDFAFYLVELLERNNYDLIIEFGSGISTAIIARVLNKMAPRRQKKGAVTFVSFDHLEHYYQQTLDQLVQAGLQKRVKLYLAPLADWQASDGNVQPYYSCQPILAELSKKYSAANMRILVVVDGPPAATGKHARYPAGPLVLEYFSHAKIDILLDDYIRDDEKEIAQRWEEEAAAMQLNSTLIKRKMEKDACLMQIGK